MSHVDVPITREKMSHVDVPIKTRSDFNAFASTFLPENKDMSAASSGVGSRRNCENKALKVLGLTRKEAKDMELIDRPKQKHIVSSSRPQNNGGNEPAQLQEKLARLQKANAQLQKANAQLQNENTRLRRHCDSLFMAQDVRKQRRSYFGPKRPGNQGDGDAEMPPEDIASQENDRLKGENPPCDLFLPQTQRDTSSPCAHVLTPTDQNDQGDGDAEMPSYDSTSQDVDTFGNPTFMGDEMTASSAELAENLFLESFKNNGGNYKKNIKIYII